MTMKSPGCFASCLSSAAAPPRAAPPVRCHQASLAGCSRASSASSLRDSWRPRGLASLLVVVSSSALASVLGRCWGQSVGRRRARRRRGVARAVFLQDTEVAKDARVSRQPQPGDAVIMSAYVCRCDSGVSEVLWRIDFVSHMIGSDLYYPELGLSPEGLSQTLLSMKEGENRSGLQPDGNVWSVKVEQVCSPRGNALGSEAATLGIEARAEKLRKGGIVALPSVDDGALSSEDVSRLREVALPLYEEMSAQIGETWLSRHRWNNVATRSGHRLHIGLTDLVNDGTLGFLKAGRPFHDVLQKAFGTDEFRMTHCAVLFSKQIPAGYTNNLNQLWHRDQLPMASPTPYAVSLFIPLVDMGTDNGATEFLTGSHLDGTEPTRDLYRTGCQDQRLVNSSQLKAGNVIMYDVRTCHRGLLHTAEGLRPTVTMNFGLDSWTDAEIPSNWGNEVLAK
eukprot:TRINITY_DN50285_c0_g1_i1.p1 TRINITY_DN50285_c0_g1~~TRINITY_DN50285_c0_g1_i1.p1  ORF type:complete len:478 (+),score=80.93 TRINITY_DN50285_c0_g1_i1:83-1435(+)